MNSASTTFTPYARGQVPSDPAALQRFVAQELAKVETAFRSLAAYLPSAPVTPPAKEGG